MTISFNLMHLHKELLYVPSVFPRTTSFLSLALTFCVVLDVKATAKLVEILPFLFTFLAHQQNKNIHFSVIRYTPNTSVFWCTNYLLPRMYKWYVNQLASSISLGFQTHQLYYNWTWYSLIASVVNTYANAFLLSSGSRNLRQKHTDLLGNSSSLHIVGQICTIVLTYRKLVEAQSSLVISVTEFLHVVGKLSTKHTHIHGLLVVATSALASSNPNGLLNSKIPLKNNVHRTKVLKQNRQTLVQCIYITVLIFNE